MIMWWIVIFWPNAFSLKNLLHHFVVFMLWAFSLSSAGTLILLADSFSPHDRSSAHPSSHKVPLSSNLLFSSLCLSKYHTYFLLPIRKSVWVTLNSFHFFPSQLIRYPMCLLTICVFLFTHSIPPGLLCVMIKSGPSSFTGWLNPHVKRGISRQSTNYNLSNDVKCRRGKKASRFIWSQSGQQRDYKTPWSCCFKRHRTLKHT